MSLGCAPGFRQEKVGDFVRLVVDRFSNIALVLLSLAIAGHVGILIRSHNGL